LWYRLRLHSEGTVDVGTELIERPEEEHTGTLPTTAGG